MTTGAHPSGRPPQGDGTVEDGAGAGIGSLLAHTQLFELPASIIRDNVAFWNEQVGGLSRLSLVHAADQPHLAVDVGVSLFGMTSVSITRLLHAVRIVRTAQDVIRTGLSNVLLQVYAQGSLRGLCGPRDIAKETSACSIMPSPMTSNSRRARSLP